MDYDLIVLGAGPAGEKGGAQAAYFGKRVAVVEAAEVGGAATNTGTLPSKVLRETAVHVAALRRRDPYGLKRRFDQDLTPDDLFFRERQVVESHRHVVMENIRRHGMTLYEGEARLVEAHTVAVRSAGGAEERITGEYILIATGSSPFRPAGVPFDAVNVYDSDSVLGLKRVPRSLVVVGGGVIGCEYASLFAALGVEVALIDRGARVLPFLDIEISLALQSRMEEMGVRVILGAASPRTDLLPEGGVRVAVPDGDTLRADVALYCVGRQGNTAALGLDALGIETDERGRVRVNRHFQTAVPHVYAAGDVIGHPALAATSMEQARVGVCHAFGFEYKQEVSPLIPFGIYTIPTVSAAGKTEEELQREGRRYVVGRSSYETNPRGQIVGDTRGFLKLIFDAYDRRLLGVHMIGEGASELVHIGQVVMVMGGTVDVFIENVFNFPTLSDLYKYAAYDALGRL